MKRLIDSIFVESYGRDKLKTGDDAAKLDLQNIADKLRIKQPFNIAYSTDSFVVNPLFFPGGDIGKLAVCGTVNDVSTSGATPLYLSIAMIIEEGFSLESLKKICKSICETAKQSNVEIVTGDTKVVEKGHCDGIFINTSGIGIIPNNINLSGANCKPGDKILVSGTLGDHGITIMAERQSLGFSADIKSDAAPLNSLISDILKAAPQTRAFRDPTRGGIASTLNEFAQQSGVSILIDEQSLPVKQSVLGACEMLGLDVVHVANEGKIIAVVPEDQAEAALLAAKNNKYGAQAAVIGQVVETENNSVGNKVYMKTIYGSKRIVDMLVGAQLPRIC